MTAIRTVETKEVKTGGYLTLMKIEDHDIYVYRPKDVMESDIINYGYSAPLILVFPERKLSEEEAVDYAEETKLAAIASENGGTVVFANPLVPGLTKRKACMRPLSTRPRFLSGVSATVFCMKTRSLRTVSWKQP